MTKSNAHILHHFYSLLLEMNFHESEEVISAQEIIADPFLQKHLRLIKLRTAKNKALLKKNSFDSIMQEIDRLKKMGIEEIKKIITPIEFLRLEPLFSKFDSLSKKDQESISEDKELLQLLEALKNKLDKSPYENE